MADNKDNQDQDKSSADDKNADKTGQDNQNNKDNEVAIPKHRFDQVNEEYKKTKARLEKLEKEREENEKKSLEEQNKFKELYEKSESKLQDLQSQISESNKKSAVVLEASKMGVREDAISDVVKLISLDEIELDETGQPTNTSSVVKNLIESKPYLLSDKGKKNLGTSTSSDKSGDAKPGKIWKGSEIREMAKDYVEYQKHKEEIDLAKKEKRVDWTQ